MGRKGGKNKKGVVVTSVDLGAFQSDQLLKEQQEADFNQRDDVFKPADSMAKIRQQKLLQEKNAEFSISQTITESEKIIG